MAGSLNPKTAAWLTTQTRDQPTKPVPRVLKPSASSRLDEFKEEAVAGASDEYLVRAAGVTAADVKGWRRKNKIRRPKTDTFDRMNALDLGDGYQAQLHTTHGGIAEGKWEVPQYVLREPLDYSQFCRLVYDMRINGEDTATICAAFGVRPADVELAAEVWERHLIGPHGRTCTRCKRQYDRRFGEESLCRTCLSTPGTG